MSNFISDRLPELMRTFDEFKITPETQKLAVRMWLCEAYNRGMVDGRQEAIQEWYTTSNTSISVRIEGAK